LKQNQTQAKQGLRLQKPTLI